MGNRLKTKTTNMDTQRQILEELKEIKELLINVSTVDGKSLADVMEWRKEKTIYNDPRLHAIHARALDGKLFDKDQSWIKDLPSYKGNN